MANTLKFGNGEWAVGKETALAYNDENGNFKPLPFTFDRASIATVVNKQGLIETVGADEPRIDFTDNTKGALLLEPSRTNLVTQSNNTTTTNVWSHYSYGGGLIVDTYGYDSPDGKNEASRLVYTNSSAGSGGALLTTNITLLATGIYTISLWAKSVSGTKEIRFSPKSTSSSGTLGSRITLTNEWKRYTHTFTNDGGTSRGFQFRIGESEDSGDRTFDVWGMTIEQGSYATSYIPTQGGSVTRVADFCSQTPPDGVIGQTEGVVYCNFKINNNPTSTRRVVIMSNGTGNERIGISLGNNILYAFIVDGGSTQCEIVKSSITSGNYKCAFAYNNNDFVFYVNGSQVGTDTNGTVATCDTIEVGNQFGTSVLEGSINDIKLYNTRLSNSELAALTQV